MPITVAGLTTVGSVAINGVDCLELVEDFSEGIGESGPSAAKKFLCEWASRYAVANGLLGFVSHTGGQGGSIVFTGPMAWPESPNLLAQAVRIKGVGKPSQGTRQIQWPYAIVEATYGTPTWGAIAYPDNSIDPGTPLVYATQEIDISLDSYTIPASAVQVTSPTAPFAKDITIPYAVAQISITLHRFPYNPAAGLFVLTGKINSAAFLGCGVGKLRFNGGKTSTTASTDGTQTRDVVLSYSFRNIARWDERFHPNGTSGWKAIQDKAGNGLIGLADLRQTIPPSYYF